LNDSAQGMCMNEIEAAIVRFAVIENKPGAIDHD
jgi:hypothetical protein